MRCTFTYESMPCKEVVDFSASKKKVVFETSSITIPDLLEDFENFLRACGFVFDGTIELVGHEEVITDVGEYFE